MEHTVSTQAEGGWLVHQLHTTSNIAGSTFLDWWAGGLQLQIEHHLFPQMPRHRLNKIKPAVMALCAKFGLDYQVRAERRGEMIRVV
jgi:fatty acid desaturase